MENLAVGRFQPRDDIEVIGFGLDHQGRYRNLPSLWAVMEMERLQDLHETFPEVAFGSDSSAADR